MMKPAARVNPRWKPWTALAVASGLAIARFFGTSSPNTIVAPVARISAIPSAMPGTTSSGMPMDSSGPSDEPRDRRLRHVADQQVGDGDADLRRGQLRRQRAQRALDALGTRFAVLDGTVHRAAIDGDERELGRDERATGRHQRERAKDEEDFDHRAPSGQPAMGARLGLQLGSSVIDHGNGDAYVPTELRDSP